MFLFYFDPFFYFILFTLICQITQELINDESLFLNKRTQFNDWLKVWALPSIMNSESAWMKPCVPLEMNSFNASTLVHIRKQIILAMWFESLNIDVFRISETCIQNSREILHVHQFYVRPSEDSMTFPWGTAVSWSCTKH